VAASCFKSPRVSVVPFTIVVEEAPFGKKD
jgi:hypothetical protein